LCTWKRLAEQSQALCIDNAVFNCPRSASRCPAAMRLGKARIPMTPFSSNTTLSAKNSQIVACPNCYAKFRFYRTNRSHIDVSSSENYRLLERRKSSAHYMGLCSASLIITVPSPQSQADPSLSAWWAYYDKDLDLRTARRAVGSVPLCLRSRTCQINRLDDRVIIVLALVDPRRDGPHAHRLGWERAHRIARGSASGG
jgi:hypothetical protein